MWFFFCLDGQQHYVIFDDLYLEIAVLSETDCGDPIPYVTFMVGFGYSVGMLDNFIWSKYKTWIIEVR